MYKELLSFTRDVLRTRAIWRDGELWTAALGGLVAGAWLAWNPAVVAAVREHFGDILTVASIIFGFVMTTLVFYVQAASSWSKDERVRNVALKLIDWHVWTVVCLLALIGYIVFLWACGMSLPQGPWWIGVEYGLLTFLCLYCGFQILNHALTVRWTFRRSQDLEGK
jgi:hypothetical protein